MIMSLQHHNWVTLSNPSANPSAFPAPGRWQKSFKFGNLKQVRIVSSLRLYDHLVTGWFFVSDSIWSSMLNMIIWQPSGSFVSDWIWSYTLLTSSNLNFDINLTLVMSYDFLYFIAAEEKTSVYDQTFFFIFFPFWEIDIRTKEP